MFVLPQSTYGNNYTIAILLYAMLWGNITLFLFCEFGEGVSSGFDEIGITIDQLDWYLLPYGMWQMLLTVTIVAHKPLGFCGFGRASCAREIFKRVIAIFDRRISTKKENILNLIFTGCDHGAQILHPL